MPERRSEPYDSPTLPQFSLPDVVGVTLSEEAMRALVQSGVEEIAASLSCTRALALAYSSREGLLRGIAAAGYQDTNAKSLLLPFTEFPAAERALRAQQAVVLSDASMLPALFASSFSGEVAIVPLFSGSRSLGVVIGQLEPGVSARSAAWQQRMLEVVAHSVLVIDLFRILMAYQDEIRLRESTRLITAAILEGHPLTEIAGLITETISQRLHEPRVGLYLRDAGQMRPISLRNVSQEYGEQITRLARLTPIAARALATDLPTYVRNAQEEPNLSPEARALFQGENITTMLMARLHHQDNVLGVLVVYPQVERVFRPSELAVFQSFTDIAAVGVAIAQQLEQKAQIAMVEERNRLAREIHDTVAQSLAALSLQIETAQTCLAAEDRSTARDMLVAARALAKKTLEDTRRAVQGLGPASLERLTPAQAIAEEVRLFEQEAGVVAQFLETGEEQELNSEQRSALLRIAQESLANIRKHAQARRVRIGLQYGLEEAMLLIEDDGIGFDASARPAPGPEGGYGLFGMSERARLLGGEVRIESTPGWGTSIRATLPYRPASLLSNRATDPSLPLPLREPRTSLVQETSTPSPLRADASTGGRIRVLVVDDHAVVRHGVRAVLEASGEMVVIGEAVDGGQAAEQARTLGPDVVLMDVQMPNVDGLEGLRRIHAALPDLPVVILTTFQSDDSIREALSLGAKGYLLKDMDSADLITAVRAAHRGEALLAPAVTERLAVLTSGQTDRLPDPATLLNAREREVLSWVAQGARNKEIATQLFLTVSTVEYHLSNIYNKLGVSNRAEAVRTAIEQGLLGK